MLRSGKQGGNLNSSKVLTRWDDITGYFPLLLICVGSGGAEQADPLIPAALPGGEGGEPSPGHCHQVEGNCQARI